MEIACLGNLLNDRVKREPEDIRLALRSDIIGNVYLFYGFRCRRKGVAVYDKLIVVIKDLVVVVGLHPESTVDPFFDRFSISWVPNIMKLHFDLSSDLNKLFVNVNLDL